jgi:hypothetical protein
MSLHLVFENDHKSVNIFYLSSYCICVCVYCQLFIYVVLYIVVCMCVYFSSNKVWVVILLVKEVEFLNWDLQQSVLVSFL